MPITPFYKFENLAASEDALLEHLTQAINETLNTRQQNASNDTSDNTVALALAGGTTPSGFYQKLSHESLNWQNIIITLTDERWVDVNHEASNEKMLKHTLLRNNAQRARFVGLKNSQSSAQLGQTQTDALLKQQTSKLDYVVLGMGADGHFASIFPSMDNTQQLLNVAEPAHCLPANPEGQPARISLTLSYLLTARHIFLLVKGQDKKNILSEQMKKDVLPMLPIHALLHQTRCPMSIYWSKT